VKPKSIGHIAVFALILGSLSATLAGCRAPQSTAFPESPGPAPTLTIAGAGSRVAGEAVPTETGETPPATVSAVATVPSVATLPPVATAPTAAIATPIARDYWPTEGWRTSTPAEQGVDAEKLAQMLDAIGQQNLPIHSVLVIRNGYIVSETYFGSDTPETKREIYSVTKSFIATLIGIAIDKGLIAGVNVPVGDFFPDRSFANWDAAKQAMTLENFLTMTTGLDWPEDDATFRRLYGSRDWVKFVLDEPMRSQPGSQFLYCSGCSHVLSAIIQAQTGMNTRGFAEQELFAPLGISNLAWDTDATGIPIGGWGLQLAPRDLAKLGYLYLNDGAWDGRQIVSKQWVRTATQTHTPSDTDLGYGYQWWTYPRWGAYAALGRYGQTIFVVPELDLIVVTTAQLDGHDPIFKLIDEYIVPAVQRPSAYQPSSLASTTRISSLALKGPATPFPRHQGTAALASALVQ
jgi:CubicO group peptidase (beta-lactamase class C family)